MYNWIVGIQAIKNIFHGLSAVIASAYYSFPSRKITVIGVTGTDGKTTTTHLIYHILKSAGKKASMVSSVYAEIAGKHYDTGFHVTTPDSWVLQRFLKQAVDAGDEYMVLEVTSHALDQNRVAGIDFAIGVLTNITHEHFDYHKTYEGYAQTKLKLLRRAKIAVVNKDDESFRFIDISINRSIITYAIKDKTADRTPEKFQFKTSLPGDYNRYNCLAAIAVAKQVEITDSTIRQSISTFPGVRGRFEQIKTGQGFNIIIDFAHTPNSFEQVLPTVRSMTKGKLIHVFGCAALRDKDKRPIMGEKSARVSNYIILTEEDYRTENVNEIIDQIAQGCRKAGAIKYSTQDVEKALRSKTSVFFRIPDRQEAIDFAIQKLAKKGDTIVLTGKAHEKSLARGTKEYTWSEHEAVEKALQI